MQNRYLTARVKFYRRAWREEFNAFLASVRRRLTIVSPYIRRAEAAQVCAAVGGRAEILTLTALKPDSILGGGLEIEALKTLAGQSRRNRLVNVPALHAKIYIADCRRAIITSANLTTAGIEFNYEYGVEIKDDAAVRLVRDDMEAYAGIGAVVGAADLETLASLAAAAGAGKRSAAARSKAARALASHCLGLQVGGKTSTALFADAVSYVLRRHGAMTTRELQAQIQALYPDLCEDVSDRVINGESYGKLWKHHLRNAQQQLKRQGICRHVAGKWEWLPR